MLIFMKNAKKFLGSGEKLSALHYHAGRAFAANSCSLIWTEDSSGREGSFDAESGARLEDVQMPDFDKVVPQVSKELAYATVPVGEVAEFLALLKAIHAGAAHSEATDYVPLVWHEDGFWMHVRGSKLRADYTLSGKTHNLAADQVRYTAVCVKLLIPIVEYFRQRKAAIRFYASEKHRTALRMDAAVDYAPASGAVLAPAFKLEEGRWDDVIPKATT